MRISAIARILALLGGTLIAADGARAGPLQQTASLSIPSTGTPTALTGDTSEARFFVGTRRNRDAELVGIDASTQAEPRVLWFLDLGVSVRALALEGTRLYVGSSANRHEIIVVDAGSGALLGEVDLPGPADVGELAVEAGGLVRALRRRSRQPEDVLLDLSDPARALIVEAREDPIGFVRPEPPATFGDHPDDSRLVSRIDWPSGTSIRSFVAVDRVGAQFQVLDRLPPVLFEDVNRDGVFRLGCLGDSNSVEAPTAPRWCRLLEERLEDELFDLVLIAEGSATAAPQPLPEWAGRDGYHHVQTALAQNVDAIILAYGTNDLFRGHAPSDVRGALEDHAATASAAGLDAFVCTVPPIIGALPATVAWLADANAQIRAAFGPARVVEFHDGFAAEHFHQDRYHLNALGQELRAERAFSVLSASRAPP